MLPCCCYHAPLPVQIPSTAKEVQFKIMRNIGLSFVRMGQYQDALQAFSTVMDSVPDHQVMHRGKYRCHCLCQIVQRGMAERAVQLIEPRLCVAWG